MDIELQIDENYYVNRTKTTEEANWRVTLERRGKSKVTVN